MAECRVVDPGSSSPGLADYRWFGSGAEGLFDAAQHSGLAAVEALGVGPHEDLDTVSCPLRDLL